MKRYPTLVSGWLINLERSSQPNFGSTILHACLDSFRGASETLFLYVQPDRPFCLFSVHPFYLVNEFW